MVAGALVQVCLPAHAHGNLQPSLASQHIPSRVVSTKVTGSH